MSRGEVLAFEIGLFLDLGPKEPLVFRELGVDLTEVQREVQSRNLGEFLEFISARNRYSLEELEHFGEVGEVD